MKWFASSVFWKASIVCSPSFCMERACGSVRVCNCGSRIWISIGTIIVRGGQGLQDRALMLPELGTQPARAAVACTGMVAEGPGRGPQRRALPDALEPEVSARRAFLAVVLGFCAAHAFDRSTQAVSCVAITCMTRPFSAPSNVP